MAEAARTVVGGLGRANVGSNERFGRGGLTAEDGGAGERAEGIAGGAQQGPQGIAADGERRVRGERGERVVAVAFLFFLQDRLQPEAILVSRMLRPGADGRGMGRARVQNDARRVSGPLIGPSTIRRSGEEDRGGPEDEGEEGPAHGMGRSMDSKSVFNMQV